AAHDGLAVGTDCHATDPAGVALQGSDTRGALPIEGPQSDSSVETAARRYEPITTQRDAARCADVTVEHRKGTAVARIPQPHGAIQTAGHYSRPVRAQRHTP